MTDFVRRQSESEKVADFLLRVMPAFGQSQEFKQLDGPLRKVPGLVAGALKDYLIRLQEFETRGNADAEALNALENVYRAIEELASNPDPGVQNLLVTEIFEHLWCPEPTLAVIKQRLKPKSSALYSRWVRE